LALLLGATIVDAAEPIGNATHPGGGANKPRIGRIFFSPAERRAHHSGGLAAQAAPIGNGIAAGGRVVVNGALSSGTQARAVWVNGAAVENSAAAKSAWTDRNGNVWVIDGTHGTRLLKPGQSIDRLGAVEDLLPPGSVTRR
jgi:hypothetical protein